MHFLQQFFFIYNTLTLKMFFAFINSKSESSTNPQTYCTGNEWPDYDKYVIAMKEEEWEEDYIREFPKLVEQFEHAWKPTKEELKVINVGTK